MLTCCNTIRGRIVCGLGGVLIAALALACLWAFSPAVTAGDDPPAKKKKGDCPDPALPQTTAKDKADLGNPTPPPLPDLPKSPKPDDSAVGLPPIPGRNGESPPPPPSDPLVTGSSPSKVPPPPAPVAETPPPPKVDVSTARPPLTTGSVPPPPDLPPMTGTGKPLLPPVADTPPATATPLPPPAVGTTPVAPPVQQVQPLAGTTSVAPSVQQVQPAVDAQDIKQLVAQLTAIRAERTKLDEHEKQTIQGIKKKYQEQKRALEQLDRELRQLGINCDETSPGKPPTRPTGADTPW